MFAVTAMRVCNSRGGVDMDKRKVLDITKRFATEIEAALGGEAVSPVCKYSYNRAINGIKLILLLL